MKDKKQVEKIGELSPILETGGVDVNGISTPSIENVASNVGKGKGRRVITCFKCLGELSVRNKDVLYCPCCKLIEIPWKLIAEVTKTYFNSSDEIEGISVTWYNTATHHTYSYREKKEKARGNKWYNFKLAPSVLGSPISGETKGIPISKRYYVDSFPTTSQLVLERKTSKGPEEIYIRRKFSSPVEFLKTLKYDMTELNKARVIEEL